MISVDALRPKAALKYWSVKVPVPKSEFDHLSDQARAKAFTVSGLAQLDQVTAVQQALAKVMDEGGTLADFKAQIGDIIKTQGWTGKKSHRIDNIFRTNLQSAYMAGRYEQLQKTTRLRPYWKYDAVEDKHTRPSHLALNGKVYPADHSFWDSYFPPNGFRCRCTVQSLSERQLKKEGYEVESEMPGPTMVKLPDGNEVSVNPMPDKGWASNVGKDWLAGLESSEVSGKVKNLSNQALCRSGQFAKGDACKLPLKDIDRKHLLPIQKSDILAKGLKDEDYVKAFLGEFGLKNLKSFKAIRLTGTSVPMVINKDFFIDKKTGLWKIKKSGREVFVRLLARTIKKPFEIWNVPVEVSGKRLPALRLIRLFQAESGDRISGYVAFNLINGRKWQAATAFTPKVGNEASMLKYLEKQRVGTLVYREP